MVYFRIWRGCRVRWPLTWKPTIGINLVNRSAKCIQSTWKSGKKSQVEKNSGNNRQQFDSMKLCSMSVSLCSSVCLSQCAGSAFAMLFSVLTRWFYCTNSQIANKHIESKETVASLSVFFASILGAFVPKRMNECTGSREKKEKRLIV